MSLFSCPFIQCPTKDYARVNSSTIQIKASVPAEAAFIISEQAMDFIAAVERKTRHRRQELLARRAATQTQFDQGIRPDFLSSTESIRQGTWRLNNTPPDLTDRRVEITGPVDRKMIINALNSGANVFMADFEDSNSPTWLNCINGQKNLYDAVRKTITYTDLKSQKIYRLNDHTAILMVRPRGWHLDEAHVLIDDIPVSASLFDALLYLFHNATALLEQKTGAYFYLPKLESHLEARLWAEVFHEAESLLKLPSGTIKVTVLIETITAAFEMNEIIHELRDYIVGLNCGRWDYIFSFIKKFRSDPNCVLPDRQLVTMTCDCMQAYVTLLIKTCHQRGIHAMGGMAAQIPIKDDVIANQLAMDKVLADKEREARAGHDGTWVAHPALIPIARSAFDKIMIGPNQLDRVPMDSNITCADLLTVPVGEITESGVRTNISVALLYLESWLSGNGCVPIRHLMEDAATAEICRAQLWQWVKFEVKLASGLILTKDLAQRWIEEEYAILTSDPSSTLNAAKTLLITMVFNPEFDEFLTLPAYPQLIKDN